MYLNSQKSKNNYFFLSFLLHAIGASLFGCQKKTAETPSLVTTPPPGQNVIQLLGFSPAKIVVGDTLVISGNNFDTDITRNIVKIGSVGAEIISSSANELKVVIPDGAAKGKVTITSNGSTVVSTQDLEVNNIYVGGYSFNGTHYIAEIWKNGIAQHLTTGSSNAFIFSVAEHNGAIYAAGNEIINGIRVARLWVNGVAKSYSDTTVEATAISIAFSGNDLYVTVTEGTQFNKILKYFKNDQEFILGNSYSDISTYIAVDGNDVYIIGRLFANNLSTPTCWKNGAIFDLGLSTTLNTSFKSISVVNGIVYLTGMKDGFATYWIDGAATGISQVYMSMGNSIKFINGKLYICGDEHIDKTDQNGFVWTDNKLVKLESDVAGKNTFVYDIDVFNNKIYISGDIFVPLGTFDASYWKDGKNILLTSNSQGESSHARSILIAP